MQQLPPEYLAELARQLAFICAVLGGFAITFFGTLLNHPSERRLVGVAIGMAALSAVGFILGTMAGTGLAIMAHPSAITYTATGDLNIGRILMALGFSIGMLGLMATLGLSGWLRSRALGWTTTVLAAFGFLAFVLVIG